MGCGFLEAILASGRAVLVFNCGIQEKGASGESFSLELVNDQIPHT